MGLGKFRKTPIERKRYTVDYTDWLDTNETIVSVAYTIEPSTTPALVIDATAILTGNKKISYYVSGGQDQETYETEIVITTSTGQVKEDVVVYAVRDV